MRAVAPGIWNNWRGDAGHRAVPPRLRVLREGRLRARGSRRARGARPCPRPVGGAAGAAGRHPDVRRADARQLLPLHAGGDDAGHGELRRRFERAEEAGERPAVATQLSAFPERDFSEFAVCTRDRPGLFAMLSGVLAAHGMNILAARIDTSRDGVALDAFRVSHEGAGRHRRSRALGARRAHVARGAGGTRSTSRSWSTAAAGRRCSTKKRRPVPTRVEFDNARVGRVHGARRLRRRPRRPAVHDHQLPLPPVDADPSREDHDDGARGARRVLRDRRRGAEGGGPRAPRADPPELVRALSPAPPAAPPAPPGEPVRVASTG